MSKVFCIIDSNRGEIVSICDTIEVAYMLNAQYCDTEYHEVPELVEDVLVEERALNEFNY